MPNKITTAAPRPGPTSAHLATATAAAPGCVRLAAPHTLRVDTATGRLTDLALMTGDREAAGHGFWIDATTLATGLAAAKTRGGRLKGYYTHDHAGPASGSWMNEPASELDVVGFFSGLSTTKTQLVASGFDFYEAFKKNCPPRYEQLMEMAAKTPDLLALSVEIWGYLVYVGTDGTEYAARPEGVDLAYDGMPALRITDIWGAAFCSDGACNDGLFASLRRGPGGNVASILSSLKNYVESLAAQFAPGGDMPPAPDARPAAADSNTTATAPAPAAPVTTVLSPTMLDIKTIKARFGADKARLAQALAIVADDEGITTIEQLEAKLGAAQLAAITAERDGLRTQLASLTTERDGLKSQLATITGERDGLKGQVASLGAMGRTAPVSLSGSDTANVDGPNPWAKGKENLTAQVALLKADPVKARALAAQAGVVLP